MADFSQAQPLPGPIPPRIRLVIALTEVNSRHLGGQTRVAAAEIELERALEDGRLGLDGPALASHRQRLQQQLDKARHELLVLDAERDWLEQALADFDTETPQASPGDCQ
jgi:hypothetical protein